MAPDVLVLDHMMPEMTGIETARVLRLQGFTKPIVLFSAYLAADVDDAARALDLLTVSKVDTQVVIRIIDVFGANPHLRGQTGHLNPHPRAVTVVHACTPA